MVTGLGEVAYFLILNLPQVNSNLALEPAVYPHAQVPSAVIGRLRGVSYTSIYTQPYIHLHKFKA